MAKRPSRFRLPSVESWSPIMRLLGRRYGFRVRLVSGILLTLVLVMLAYFDIWTFDQINLKPLAGLVVLAAFVIFRLNGIWWLLSVIFIYNEILSKHRLLPSADELALDDVIVAVTFGVIGLLIAWVAEGILALKQSHQAVNRDLKLAGEVQRQILSPPVRLPWINMEGILQPIGEVGGDFYLIVPVDERTVFFVIGDVQGKGMAAALTMAKVMAIFSELSRDNRPLNRLLKGVNERLLGGDNSMVTAQAGQITTDGKGNMQLTVARAGHESGLLVCRNRACVELNPPGLPLGVLQDAQYEEQTWKLGSGDRVLFHTDGLVDARNEELKAYGRDQLVKLAVQLARRSTDNEVRPWLLRIMDEVEAFRGSQMLEDDIAVLGAYFPVQSVAAIPAGVGGMDQVKREGES